MKNINTIYLSLILSLILAPALCVAAYDSESLIIATENGVQGSPFLKSMQDTLLRMNDLSYNRVKAGDAYLRFADNEHTRLEREGWDIRGFRGLEGRRSDFIDLSGIVSYNADLNVIAVVYHGTAGSEGWETNFEAMKLNPRYLVMELGKDLYEEMREKFSATLFNPAVKELKQTLKAFSQQEFTSSRMADILHQIEDMVTNGVIDSALGQHLSAPIRLKLELVDYIEKTGVNIGGAIHKGFAKKYFSTKREVINLIRVFVQRLPADKVKSVKIVMSGHSQAGGTANLAQADIMANHSEEIFGTKINNSQSGTFYGYFLSAARVGDRVYARWMHENVGKDNIARQNVKGDPVPIASGDKDMAKTLKASVPALGELLSETADYADTGHLLFDDAKEVWERAKASYLKAGIDVYELEAFTNGLYNAASMMFGTEAIPDFIATQPEYCSWNPITKAKNCIDTIGFANKTISALRGKSTAQNELSDLATKRYAHLHYGHFRREVNTAVFDPLVVGRDIDKMLMQGVQHEEKKHAIKVEEKSLSRQNSTAKVLRELYPKTLAAALSIAL